MKVFSSLTIEAEIWLLVNDRVQDLTWFKVGKIELKSVKQWVHCCVGHKRSEGLIEASVDGRQREMFQLSQLSVRESFNISLGKSYYKYFKSFFGGLVTNINIFLYNQSLDLEAMSSEPCKSAGDVLSWADSTWLHQGDGLAEMDLEPEEICGDVRLHNVLLPSQGKWSSASHLCSILGDGRIPEVRNMKAMQDLVNMSDVCKFVWTPYTDEEEENKFLSTYSGQPMPDLPWRAGNPNLGRAANRALIFYNKRELGLVDAPHYREACIVCNISKVCRIFSLSSEKRISGQNFQSEGRL